uniref:Uncharacterized protein n=1 Tax=Ananas comosus var. bracteatus TaxID=296719 RepID=A0A6V7QA80_ANACO|nr:unnamed protein product [Ananas comosus var. bracteatus]
MYTRLGEGDHTAHNGGVSMDGSDEGGVIAQPDSYAEYGHRAVCVLPHVNGGVVYEMQVDTPGSGSIFEVSRTEEEKSVYRLYVESGLGSDWTTRVQQEQGGDDGDGSDQGAVEPGGGRAAAAAGAGARGEELVADKPVDPGAVGEVVPVAVVQPALAAGGAPPLHARGGRDHPPRPPPPRQQVGHHRPPPLRPHRQRRQEPLELHPQAQALPSDDRHSAGAGAAAADRDEAAARPLKRASSVGPVLSSGLCFSPGSPAGSDLSDSSHHSHPAAAQLYRASTAPSASLHPIAAAADDPATSLTLSLPGSYQGDAAAAPAPAPPPPSAAAATESPSPSPSPFQFSSEFVSLMQEMIRDEVRSYMLGLENSGAAAKRIGVAKFD